MLNFIRNYYNSVWNIIFMSYPVDGNRFTRGLDQVAHEAAEITMTAEPEETTERDPTGLIT